MSKIETQFNHIFIHYYSNKSSSTCKLFISELNKTQEEKMGRLFGILEINTPSRENSQIITQLINLLENSYYSQIEDEDLDIDKAFEKSLEEVNRKFTQLLQDKQIHLVGNLNEYTINEKINLVVGVLKENQLNLSYLNNMGIFLIHKTKQDYKLIDIKKSATEEKTQNEKSNKPPRLFSNTIKGEVNAPDFLFLANNNFLEYITQERIRKTITSLPIHKAAEYFKNSLLQHEGHNFAAIIIKNSLIEVKEKKEPASVTSIAELNYTETSTEKLLTSSFWSSVKGASGLVIKLLKKDKDDLDNEEDDQKIDSVQKEPGEIKSAKSNKLMNLVSNIFTNSYRLIKKLLKKILSHTPALNENLQKMKSYSRLKLAYLGNYFKKIPNLSKILLIIAVLFALLFIYSTSYFKHQQNKEVDSQEFQNIVNQIQEKKNQAESNIIFGDEKKARTEITEAQKLLANLPVNSKKQKETQEQLNKEVEAIIAKLRHITTINDPILITDLSNQQENNINVQNIVYQNNQIIAFDNINNISYQINPETKEVAKIYSNLSDIGQINKAKSIGNKILIYHDDHGFVEFSANKFIPLTIGLQSGGKIADFTDYNNRIYTVDINNNQIYRHSVIEGGYGSGVAWLKESINLNNIVSIGIDTNIWLLDNTGKILKLNKGNQQNFTTKNLDPALIAPTALFTNDETNHLYILEPKNQRIVVLDKEGNLITQYYSQIFDNLKSMSIFEKEKKIFIVNDNKIYFFNLTHL